MAAQISEALAHAHAKGIVHRDVKPSNVLLAESGSIDVRLLDFGLAQMAEFDTLTALGDIPGTLAYIAPERLHGRTATTAADVWGVGVLLWEALVGVHPFWGGDTVETSRRIQLGAPPLESERPDLPRHVLDTVASALLVNPQRRPSAERLAQELRSLPKRRRKKGGSKPTAPSRPLERRRRGARAARRPRRRGRRLDRDPDPVLPRSLADRARRRRRRARLRRPARRAPVRARRGVLPARQHLARPGRRLRGAGGRLGGAQLARRARRPAARRRAAARADRRTDADPASSRRSHAAAPAAPPRLPVPSCSPRSSPGSGAHRCHSTGRRRRSGSASPAPTARRRSPRRSGRSSQPTRS